MNGKMPTPDATFVRLECLRLVISRHGPSAATLSADETLAEAGKLADFCVGRATLSVVPSGADD